MEYSEKIINEIMSVFQSGEYYGHTLTRNESIVIAENLVIIGEILINFTKERGWNEAIKKNGFNCGAERDAEGN